MQTMVPFRVRENLRQGLGVTSRSYLLARRWRWALPLKNRSIWILPRTVMNLGMILYLPKNVLADHNCVHPMKILLICSKAFYGELPSVQKELESRGHTVLLPNCFDDPGTEDRMRAQGPATHATFKGAMFRRSEEVIASVDAVLVMNFEKKGIPNYIGGATFLEMYDAFRLGKKIFLLNDVPVGILADEIRGFAPVLLGGDLGRIGGVAPKIG